MSLWEKGKWKHVSTMRLKPAFSLIPYLGVGDRHLIGPKIKQGECGEEDEQKQGADGNKVGDLRQGHFPATERKPGCT
eukprot:1140759-Pelagomonas_calceolata.AAC.1